MRFFEIVLNPCLITALTNLCCGIKLYLKYKNLFKSQGKILFCCNISVIGGKKIQIYNIGIQQIFK